LSHLKYNNCNLFKLCNFRLIARPGHQKPSDATAHKYLESQSRDSLQACGDVPVSGNYVMKKTQLSFRLASWRLLAERQVRRLNCDRPLRDFSKRFRCELFLFTVFGYNNNNNNTRVGTLIVATIYLQLIQNRYMFRSFTVLQCSHQHCVQPVASDVEVVGYL